MTTQVVKKSVNTLAEASKTRFYNPAIAQTTNLVKFVRETVNAMPLSKAKNLVEYTDTLADILDNHLTLESISWPNASVKVEVLGQLGEEFPNLSLTEVAFALRRQRSCGQSERVDHYGQPTFRYFSEILIRFKSWRRDIRDQHGIKVHQPEEIVIREFSDSEKEEIIRHGIRSFWYNDFIGPGGLKEPQREVPNGRLWIFEHMEQEVGKDFTEHRNAAESNLIEAWIKRKKKIAFPTLADRKKWKDDAVADSNGTWNAKISRIAFKRYCSTLWHQSRNLYAELYPGHYEKEKLNLRFGQATEYVF